MATLDEGCQNFIMKILTPDANKKRIQLNIPLYLTDRSLVEIGAKAM